MAYSPTHAVPAGGLPAWGTPDGSKPPVTTLEAGLDVQVVEERGQWARVSCSNGWEGWVDSGRLTVVMVPEPVVPEPVVPEPVTSYVAPAEGVRAWQEPDPAQPPIVTLAAGTELRLLEQRGQWAHVEASNGWTGWVDATLLQPAPSPEPTLSPEPTPSLEPTPSPEPVTSYVVPADGIQAWQEPDPAQHPIATLHGGTAVRLLEQRGQWAQVETPNGWTVWVDASRLAPEA